MLYIFHQKILLKWSTIKEQGLSSDHKDNNSRPFDLQVRGGNAFQVIMTLSFTHCSKKSAALLAPQEEGIKAGKWNWSNHKLASSSQMVWLFTFSRVTFSSAWMNHGIGTRLNCWVGPQGFVHWLISAHFCQPETSWKRNILQKIRYSSNVPWRQALMSTFLTTGVTVKNVFMKSSHIHVQILLWISLCLAELSKGVWLRHRRIWHWTTTQDAPSHAQNLV